jgi:prolyl-tRNA editing enzyme YbaK/EbsC (Cys-tRNA(Pro) deacylase)
MRRQLNDGGWTDAKPEQVLEAVGCAVGCVPPFGQLTPIPVFMDPDLVQQEFVYFNPGRHDKSFKIKTGDLQKVSRPKFI